MKNISFNGTCALRTVLLQTIDHINYAHSTVDMAATTWLEPDYNIVDIIEFEMEIEKRRRIEDFVIQFFKDWENAATTKLIVYVCQQLIIKEKKLYTITNDSFRHVTLVNFKVSFQAMCDELFGNNNNVKDEYVVSLLAFCIELDACMRDRLIEYTPKLLITSLIDALERVNFNPVTFNWNRQTGGELIENILTSFLFIIPSLLFFYVLLK